MIGAHINVRAFLFDSAFQIVTWVCIAACLAGLFYCFGKRTQKKRHRKGIMLWSLGLALSVLIMLLLLAYRYATEPEANFQTQKPYVTIKTSEIDPLVAGKKPTFRLKVENGPGESSVAFLRITFVLTPFVPEKYLSYIKTPNDQSFKLAPHQIKETRWESPLALSQDDISNLDAENPMAELYIFARGNYTTETGTTGSLDVCFKYDRGFANHVAICDQGIKIE